MGTFIFRLMAVANGLYWVLLLFSCILGLNMIVHRGLLLGNLLHPYDENGGIRLGFILTLQCVLPIAMLITHIAVVIFEDLLEATGWGEDGGNMEVELEKEAQDCAGDKD